MPFVLTNCEKILLREISDTTFKQRDIAKTYALAMASGEDVNWLEVNKAIIRRWSTAGLVRIKEAAWSRRWRGQALFDTIEAA